MTTSTPITYDSLRAAGYPVRIRLGGCACFREDQASCPTMYRCGEHRRLVDERTDGTLYCAEDAGPPADSWRCDRCGAEGPAREVREQREALALHEEHCQG